MNKSIDELELSVRSYNCLKNAGIRTVEELQMMSKEQLKSIKHLGQKSIKEIRDTLADLGVTLWRDRQLFVVVMSPAKGIRSVDGVWRETSPMRVKIFGPFDTVDSANAWREREVTVDGAVGYVMPLESPA